MPLGAARFGLLGGVADLGKLELIETKDLSSVSSATFTDIKENEYNVHFLTLNNFSVSTYNEFCAIRLFENGVEETASVYQFAYQYNEATGGNAESKSTTGSAFRGSFSLATGTNYVSNSYSYFYNLGDSTKYSFHTVHSSGMLTSLNFRTYFGSSVLPQASTVDQIKLFVSSGTFSATASLYGIAES